MAVCSLSSVPTDKIVLIHEFVPSQFLPKSMKPLSPVLRFIVDEWGWWVSSQYRPISSFRHSICPIDFCTTSGRIREKSNKFTMCRTKFRHRFFSIISRPCTSTNVWQATGIWTSPIKLKIKNEFNVILFFFIIIQLTRNCFLTESWRCGFYINTHTHTRQVKYFLIFGTFSKQEQKLQHCKYSYFCDEHNYVRNVDL